jgi:hypothetical protein
MHGLTAVDQPATPSTTADFASALQQTQAYVRTLKTIKLFLPDCRNFGHQSSSINILLSLVRLGFSGHCIVVGENQGALEKLRPLLPIDPSKVPPWLDLTVDGRQATLSFTTLRAPSQQPAELCLTGGYDWPSELLRQLDCPNIVALQHYQWTKYLSEHSVIIGAKKYDLTVSLGKDFPLLAFYRQVGHLDYSLLQRFLELPAWQAIIPLMTSLLDLYHAEQFYLCPVYGINTGRISPQRCLFNLLSGIADLQGRTACAKKAVVLIFSPQAAPGSIAIDFNKLATFLQTSTWPGISSARYVPSQACMHWLTRSALDKRVKYFSVPHETNVTQAIRALHQQDILLVQVGPVPAVLFDYIYSIANLPVVFEGQHTAALALNVGKPYVHLTEPGVNTHVYPLWSGYEAVALRAQQVARALHCYPSAWETPDQEAHPNRSIGQFLWESVGNVDDSQLVAYFRTLGDFYHNPQHDKLWLALNFLVSKLHA